MLDPNRKTILEFLMKPRLEVLGMFTLLLFAATLPILYCDTIICTSNEMKVVDMPTLHHYSHYLLCYLVQIYKIEEACKLTGM